MYIKIKNAMNGATAMVTVSKLTSVAEVRDMIQEKMEVAPNRQRLFFQGKQLEDEYSLFDYNVKVNDIIQLMVRQPLGESHVDNLPKKEKEAEKEKNEKKEEKEIKPVVEEVPQVEDAESEVFKVGDSVDVQDSETGAWFEANIRKITRNDTVKGFDGLAYHIEWEGYEKEMEGEQIKVGLGRIRSRAKTRLNFTDLDLGHQVFVNYNVDAPESRGFWYDSEVSGWKCTSKEKSLVVTLKLFGGQVKKDCKIHFLEELMKAEPAPKLSAKVNTVVNVDVENDAGGVGAPAAGGDGACKGCGDNRSRRCKQCGCHQCGGKDDPNSQIMCDECDMAYHLQCLGMTALPDVDEWFCPECKNNDDIVGGSRKMDKKKLGAGTQGGNRDWGKGFATVGRTKVCNKVDKNHFGPIPGIEVGMSWMFRVQVSEEGLHRPPVAGIAGTAALGCPSLVLSGGYEDDEDHGDYFTYTGSGGRDLSGNKRTAEQSHDQKLDKSNAALARNCKVRFNPVDGGDAGEEWTKGKPIRVVRNYKGSKHSKYAPEEGNRYDGIYKVVKYWPEKGKSGFKVWRYMLRRDDTNPAPWTEEGKKIMENEGYSLIYPEGYLEAQAAKEEEQGKTPKANKRKKKVEEEEDDDFINDDDENNEASPAAKKKKTSVYNINAEWLELMEADAENKALWDQVKEKGATNKKELTDFVEEIFCCIICQDIVFKPVTTPCGHNFCFSCIERSFSAGQKGCPSCRADLGEDYLKSKPANLNLKKILLKIFPGYEAGR